MIRGYIALIFFVSNLYAMQSHERIIGNLVSVRDQKNMKELTQPNEIIENEIVAVWHRDQWLYAQVTVKPRVGSTGLVNATPETPVYYNFAANFRSHVRKLVQEHETEN